MKRVSPWTQPLYPNDSFEFSSSVIPTTISHKPSVPVHDWLSARYLLRSMSDNVIESCYDDIINSFSDRKQIIHTLVKASTTKQIKNIIEILKIAQTKEIENNNDKIIYNINKNTNNNDCYFDYLCEQSIFNICEFLDKNDIWSFKLTSTFNALVVFDVMKSYKIGVLNMNELIQNEQYKYPLPFNINNKITLNRHKHFTKNKSLLDIYSKRYDIPEKHLLILTSMYSNYSNSNSFGSYSSSDHFGYNTALISSVTVNNINTWKEQIISKTNVSFIFDKTKILTLNNTQKLLMMNKVHKAEEMRNYGVVLLQYFNVQQQHIQNVQFIWLDFDTISSRIEQYIANDLYSVINNIYNNKHISLKWCDKLLNQLNKMKQFGSHPDCKLINIYINSGCQSNFNNIQYIAYQPMQNSIKNLYGFTNWINTQYFSIMTFEINYNHPFFKSKIGDKIDKKTQCHPIWNNVSQFMSNQKAKFKLEMKYIYSYDMLLKQIKYFDVNGDIPSFENNLILSIYPSTTFRMIKNQIVSKLKHIIPAKYIQLYVSHRNSWDNEFEKLSVLSNNDHIQTTSTYLIWEIVPYDTSLDENYNINKVSIYDHDDQSWDIFATKTSKRLTINYSKLYVNKESIIKHNEDDIEHKNDTDNNSEPLENVSDSFTNNQNININMPSVECSEQNNNNNDNDKNIKFKFIVDQFVDNLIEHISHSMYQDEYKSILKKYKDKTNYSFIVMDKNEINKQDYKCFVGNNQYIRNKPKNKSELFKFECHDDSEYDDINVMIIKNINYIENKTDIPIIIRFSKLALYQSTFQSFSALIGYPIKIWITKQDTPQTLKKKCFDNNLQQKFEINSCYLMLNQIGNDDIIYQHLKLQTSDNDKNIHKLLMVLKPVDIEKQDAIFNPLSFAVTTETELNQDEDSNNDSDHTFLFNSTQPATTQFHFT